MLHKTTNIETVRQCCACYENHSLTLDDCLGQLGIKRRRFYQLLRTYRAGTLTSLQPKRSTAHLRLPQTTDDRIRAELDKEKELITNKDSTIRFYNYQAVTDTVNEQLKTPISAQTIRNRAKDWGYWLGRPLPQRAHTRVVMTTASGMLLQHDASTHLYAPDAAVKWVLITTLDDYSRLLVFADLFLEESSWAHIAALQSVVETYGVGANYYTDNHAIFRFTQRTETYFRKPQKDPVVIKTQWEMAVKATGMGIIYATSPEGKGKIERPYRWLQDRLTRRCAKAHVTSLDDARALLHEEIHRYNERTVHSTTKEIPLVRFRNSLTTEGQSIFTPFVIPQPYTSSRDIFCLREERKVDGYNQIQWRGNACKLTQSVPEGATVQLHIVPDEARPELRIWYKDRLIQSVSFVPTNKAVHHSTETEPTKTSANLT